MLRCTDLSKGWALALGFRAWLGGWSKAPTFAGLSFPLRIRRLLPKASCCLEPLVLGPLVWHQRSPRGVSSGGSEAPPPAGPQRKCPSLAEPWDPGLCRILLRLECGFGRFQVTVCNCPCACVRAHACTRTRGFLCVYTCVHAHTCGFVNTHASACLCAHMVLCTHVCVWVCAHACARLWLLARARVYLSASLCGLVCTCGASG